MAMNLLFEVHAQSTYSRKARSLQVNDALKMAEQTEIYGSLAARDRMMFAERPAAISLTPPSLNGQDTELSVDRRVH